MDDTKFFLSDDGSNINLCRSPYNTEGLSMAVIGNKGSGKSWTLAVLAEEAHRQILPFIFFDINGDAVSLRTLGDDVLVVGRRDLTGLRRGHYRVDELNGSKSPELLADAVLSDGISIIFDLSGLDDDGKFSLFASFSQIIFDKAQVERKPFLMIVDEAHRIAPQKHATAEQRNSRKQLINIMSDGRKRGILLAVATQRAALLDKDVLYGMNVRMFGKITHYPDFISVRPYLPPGTSFRSLARLKSGRCYLITQNGWGLIRVKQRRTCDLGVTPMMHSKRKRRSSISDLQLGLDLL